MYVQYLIMHYYHCFPFYSRRDECEALGNLAGIEGTDVWCQRQCLRYPSKCPRDKCRCFSRKREKLEAVDNGVTVF